MASSASSAQDAAQEATHDNPRQCRPAWRTDAGTSSFCLEAVRRMESYSKSAAPGVVAERDRFYAGEVKKLSKKVRKAEEGSRLRNTKELGKEDLRSVAVEACERNRGTTTHASADPPGAQTFRPGQAVLQWWAAWMRDCNTLGSAPQSYSGRKKTGSFSRPAWFSGEVLAGPTKESCTTFVSCEVRRCSDICSCHGRG